MSYPLYKCEKYKGVYGQRRLYIWIKLHWGLRKTCIGESISTHSFNHPLSTAIFIALMISTNSAKFEDDQVTESAKAKMKLPL